MPIYGTDNAYGVPISLSFEYDGTLTNWGSTRAYDMAPLSNKAESVDGGYEISNMDVQFIDTDGAVWSALGNGTGAFNKTFSATVYVGGSMGYSSYGPQAESRLALQGLGSAATYTVHSGKVVEVSKKNRLVRIKSHNTLRSIADLEWRFPYKATPLVADSVIGSYFFFNNTNLGTLYLDAVTKSNQDKTEFEFFAAIDTAGVGSLGSSYPSIAGRGTLGLLTGSGYVYPGTQFYFDMQRYRVTVEYIGTKTGTISSLEEANRYGYPTLDAAELAKDITVGGVGYPLYRIAKTRLRINNGSALGSRFFLQQNLTLTETPANLFRELVAGHCVTPYLGTTDLEATTFADAQSQTAFQTFTCYVDPEGGKVAPVFKNLVESVYGLFSVNTNNKIEFRPYSPRNLKQVIPSIGTSDILESEYSNSLDDYFNRVLVKYCYDPDTKEFNKTYETKIGGWTMALDRPYTVESKFMRNENEAIVFAGRLLRRFSNTSPRMSFTVPLKYAGAGIGSLYTVTDADSGIGGKTVEIIQYEKDFTENKKVEFKALDAEALYLRKGFAKWGTGIVLPGNVVNTNSISGWGSNGTCPGIDTTYCGTCFVWW